MKYLLVTSLFMILVVSCSALVDPGQNLEAGSETVAGHTALAKPQLQSPAKGDTVATNMPVLAWYSVEGADIYRVRASTVDDFSIPLIDDDTPSLQYKLSEIPSDTTIYWQVRAEGADSTVGPWSESWNFTTGTPPDPPANNNPPDMWVSAYLASYNHYVEPTGNWGNLKTDEIDWDAFTHLFYFSLQAQPDGTFSKIAPYENLSPDRIRAIVSAAHQHGKRVLITVGGWGNYDGFSQAISPAIRPVFVANIVSIVTTWNFDGVDLDLEPIRSSDTDNYSAFIKALHAALSAVSTPLEPKPLLTAATDWNPGMFADLEEYFDQINLMTYDLSGAWQGWVSWHNSAVRSGSLTFPGTDKPLPSIETKIRAFRDAGVPESKLGIGIDFYGYVWSGGTGMPTGGVTEPNQSWTTAPTVTDNVPYHIIMRDYYQADRYRWDPVAEAAYLKIDMPDDSDDKFISYDNEESVRAKIKYIRNNNLGGAILWELGGAYRASEPSGSRDKLLQSVKNAVWY